MDKKKIALAAMDCLEKLYPDAKCSLTYAEPYQLMIAVRLSAQCTDARVNIVTKDLFREFPTLDSFADADITALENAVKPCGFYRAKAKSIKEMCQRVRDVYGGKVPDDFETLLELPGVGRKSANLIMGDVFGKPAIVTDTHCIRLVNRFGLVDGIKEPAKVEKELWKIIPPEEGNDFCHRLVDHGRAVCTARTKPYCDRCCLRDICKQIL